MAAASQIPTDFSNLTVGQLKKLRDGVQKELKERVKQEMTTEEIALPILETYGEFFACTIGQQTIEEIPDSNIKLFGNRPLPIKPQDMTAPKSKGTLSNQCPYIIVKFNAVDNETKKIIQVSEIIFRIQSGAYITSRAVTTNGDCTNSYLADGPMTEDQLLSLKELLEGNTVKAPVVDDILLTLAEKVI